MESASRILELEPDDTRKLVRWSAATHRAFRIQVSEPSLGEDLETIDPDLERVARIAEYCFRESGLARCAVFMTSDLGFGDELDAVQTAHGDLEVVARRPADGDCTDAQVNVGSAPSLAGVARTLWSHCSFFFVLFSRDEITSRDSLLRSRKPPGLTASHPAALTMYYGEGDFLVMFFEKDKDMSVEKIQAALLGISQAPEDRDV